MASYVIPSSGGRLSHLDVAATQPVHPRSSETPDDPAQSAEALPGDAFANVSPIKMGDGEAPVAQELRYLGSMLSKNFDDSVTIRSIRPESD